MIQDIAPKKLYNEYEPTESTDNDYIAIFVKNEILVKEIDGQMQLPKRMELANCFADFFTRRKEDEQYLFRIDTQSYFLVVLEERCEKDRLRCADSIFHLAKLSAIRNSNDHELSFAVYTAYHLYRWYQNNKYCGGCGTHTVPDTKERMLFCPNCGNQIYPKIAPAVIAAVTNGDKLLLTKYANREYTRYALIAGFTEIGETAEQTVRREVMEEAGIRVKNIRYYKSQPWGIDGNLLFGYFAELDGSDQISIDENELSCAEWVSREALKDMDDCFSLTREMMRVFYESK